MQPAPKISVIVPVLNGARYLDRTLAALRASSREPDEIIVIDDGSTDGSSEIAERHGVMVLRTEGREGPAAARSIGAKEASGDILMFVDADVAVHRDTVERMAGVFVAEPSAAAVFGSYDRKPSSETFVSQWKNLSHHFFHQQGAERAQTFWAGCGAIRKKVFADIGGFDLRYRGATIEDIELGYRLRQRGYRVLLRHDILCTHQKEWSTWGAFKTDLLYRGIPWVRLILRSGVMPDDLNVSGTQRLSTAIAWILVALFALAAFSLPIQSLVGIGLFVLLMTHQFWTRWGDNEPGGKAWLLPAIITASATSVALWMGLPLFALAFVLGLALRFSFRRRTASAPSAMETAVYVCYFTLAIAAMVTDIPFDRVILMMGAAGIVLIGLNQPYYSFFLATRGLAFTAAVLPFQFGYHFLNGISVVAGSLMELRESRRIGVRAAIRTAIRRQTP